MSSSLQDVQQDEREEDDADHAVDREERRVETAQVAGTDERVLVREQAATATTPAQ